MSRPEQGERYDGDAVAPAIRELAGRDDDPVGNSVADSVVEPGEVPDVAVVDSTRRLDLDRQHRSVLALDDEVDLPVRVLGAEMPDPGLGGGQFNKWTGRYSTTGRL
jgi:uncharacterized protein (UPF0218 family)